MLFWSGKCTCAIFQDFCMSAPPSLSPRQSWYIMYEEISKHSLSFVIILIIMMIEMILMTAMMIFGGDYVGGGLHSVSVGISLWEETETETKISLDTNIIPFLYWDLLCWLFWTKVGDKQLTMWRQWKDNGARVFEDGSRIKLLSPLPSPQSSVSASQPKGEDQKLKYKNRYVYISCL